MAALEEVREALRSKARERRYLAAFRQQHAEFLKRYAAAQSSDSAGPARRPRRVSQQACLVGAPQVAGGAYSAM